MIGFKLNGPIRPSLRQVQVQDRTPSLLESLEDSWRLSYDREILEAARVIAKNGFKLNGPIRPGPSMPGCGKFRTGLRVQQQRQLCPTGRLGQPPG